MSIHAILRNSRIYFNSDISAQRQQAIVEKLSGATHGARIHRLKGYTQFLSISFGETHRIILDQPAYNGSKVFRVVGELPNHEYDKKLSKFKTYSDNVDIDESTLWVDLNVDENDADEHPEVNSPLCKTRYNVILSQNQDDILAKIGEESRSHPIFVEGTPGGGKTLIAQLYMQQKIHDGMGGKYTYLCFSDKLAKHQEQLFLQSLPTSSKNTNSINFISLETLYRQLNILPADNKFENYESFTLWINEKISEPSRNTTKIKEMLKNININILYYEIKNILAQKLTLQDYHRLPISQTCIITPENKALVYELYNNYYEYCASNHLSFIELLIIDSEHLDESFMSTQIVLDEVQSVPLPAIAEISKLSTMPLIMLGDINQADVFFHLHSLASIMASAYPGKPLEVLQLTENYRCPLNIVDTANRVLDLSREVISGSLDTAAITQAEFSKQSAQEIIGEVSIINQDIDQYLKTIQDSQLSITLFVTDSLEEAQKYRRINNQMMVLPIEYIAGLEFTHIVYLPGEYGNHVLEILNSRCQALKLNQVNSPQQKATTHHPKCKTQAQKNLHLLHYLRQLFTIITRASESVNILCANKLRHLKEFVMVNQTLATSPAAREVTLKEQIENICHFATVDASEAINIFIQRFLPKSTNQVQQALKQIAIKFTITPQLLTTFLAKHQQEEQLIAWLNSIGLKLTSTEKPPASKASSSTQQDLPQKHTNKKIEIKRNQASTADVCDKIISLEKIIDFNLHQYILFLKNSDEFLLAKEEKDKFISKLESIKESKDIYEQLDKLQELNQVTFKLTNNQDKKKEHYQNYLQQRTTIIKSLEENNKQPNKHVKQLISNYLENLSLKPNSTRSLEVACLWLRFTNYESKCCTELLMYIVDTLSQYGMLQCLEDYIHIGDIHGVTIFQNICILQKEANNPHLIPNILDSFSELGITNLSKALAHETESEKGNGLNFLANEAPEAMSAVIKKLDLQGKQCLGKLLLHENCYGLIGFQVIVQTVPPSAIGDIVNAIEGLEMPYLALALMKKDPNSCMTFHMLCECAPDSIPQIMQSLNSEFEKKTLMKLLSSKAPKIGSTGLHLVIHYASAHLKHIVNALDQDGINLLGELLNEKNNIGLSVFHFLLNYSPQEIPLFISVLNENGIKNLSLCLNQIEAYNQQGFILMIKYAPDYISDIVSVLTDEDQCNLAQSLITFKNIDNECREYYEELVQYQCIPQRILDIIHNISENIPAGSNLKLRP